MKKLICGVGVNDVDYAVTIYSVSHVQGVPKRKLVWVCPFYKIWVHMIKRGHSDKLKARQPTYKDCKVCKDWHLFSNFKAWMEQQDWQGNQLDKDLLVRGNKIYSPDTCVFVSRSTNNFMIDAGAIRGKYMIGVCREEKSSRFRAWCNNPFTKKQEYLGRFDTELEAHKAWLGRKLEHAYNLAAIQTDERVAKALIDRYTNYN